VSLATVSSRASPVLWTLCCLVLGRRPSHSSSDCGHNAWVSEAEQAFSSSSVLTCRLTLRASRRRHRFLDSMPISMLGSLNQLTSPFCQPIFFLWFNAESILLFLHQQPDVAHLAAVYLKYASIGLPAYAFNCVSRYALCPNSGNG
jgi:MatE